MNSGERIYYPRTIQQIFTITAKPALFPVKVIKSQGIMHDAFRFHAVIKPEEMADFMGTLFHRPIDQIVLAPGSAVKFIGEAGSGHDRSTGRRTGQAEQRGYPWREDIIPGNHKDMIPDTLPLLEQVNSFEQDTGIGLATRAHISAHDERVCAYP